MKRYLSLIALTMINLIFSVTAVANVLIANVDKSYVYSDDYITLNIVSDAQHSANDIDFSVLNKDFEVGKVYFSASSNYINGTHSERSRWSVELLAKHSGKLVIPSFELQGAKSNPITLTAAKDPNEPDIDNIVSYQVKVADNPLYPKQNTTITYRLIIKKSLRYLDDVSLSDASIDGMQLTRDGEAKQYTKQIDGVTATVVDIKYHLSAVKPGTFVFHPPAFSATMDYYSSWGSRNRHKKLRLDKKPQQVNITVNPIPAGYKGVWFPAKNLRLSQTWTDENGRHIDASKPFSLSEGSVITRNIKLQAGMVNVEGIPSFAITYPQSVQHYDQKPKYSTDSKGIATMTLQQVLIPSAAGTLTLPGVEVQWWNLQTNKEVTSKIAPLTITVSASKSKDAKIPVATPPAQKKAQPEKTPPVKKVAPKPAASAWNWLYIACGAGFGLVVLLIAAFMIWKKYSGAHVASAHDNDITAVIKQGDPIVIQSRVSVWLKQHAISAATQAAIKQELALMNASFYSTTQRSAWDNSRLLELIKKAQHEADNPPDDPALASL